MRKLIFTTLLFSATLFSFGQNSAKISGTIKNLGKNEVLLFRKKEKGSKLAPDTIKVVDGKFNFEYKTRSHVQGFLSIVDLEIEKQDMASQKPFYMLSRGRRPGYFSFFLEPNSTIIFSIDANEYPYLKISGDLQINNDMQGHLDVMKGFDIEYDKRRMKTLSFMMDKRDSKEYQEADKKAKEIYNHFNTLSKEWVAKNRNNEFAMYLFSEQRFEQETGAELNVLFGNYSEKLKKGIYGKKVQALIDQKSVTDPGVTAPEFTLKNLYTGKDISLSDYRGRYVLLDFWGSWCMPCRASHPELKEKYSKYKGDKFEILGLAEDKTDDIIKKAAEEDGLTWQQVRLSEVREGQKKVTQLYAIKAFPTKILVDPSGKIVAVNDRITEKLKEIFGK